MFYGKKILLTGGRAPATLHLARILNQQHCTVVVADVFEHTITAASRFVDAKHSFPSPVYHPKKFINSLLRIIKDEGIEILIPTCEETFHIARHKERLQNFCQVFCSDLDPILQLHHKYKFHQLLKTVGLSTPKSYLVQNFGEFEHHMAQFPRFVFKPAFSRFGDQVIINDRKYLKREIFNSLNVSAQQPWVVQEFIEGEHLSSFSIIHQQKITAHASYPLQHRVTTGSATLFEVVEAPTLFEFTQQLLQHIDYEGFLSFDFIHSNEDGNYYCIECNPRLTSGIHLFSPYDRIWDYSLGTTFPSSENKQMLGLALLLYRAPTINSFAGFAQLMNTLLNSKDVIFSLKDINPFIAQFGSLYHFWKEAREKGISIVAATTADIAWNGDSH